MKSRSRAAGATESEDSAPEPVPTVAIVRDKPAMVGGPTTLTIDEPELPKYEAGGWRRATAKEAKAIEKDVATTG